MSQFIKFTKDLLEGEHHSVLRELGRVIGKGGKIASSIRTIAKSTAGRDRRKVFVKFGE